MIKRSDGWVNTVLGLGSAATDRRVSGYHTESARITSIEYATMFYEDGLVRRIIQAEPFDALRQGFELTAVGLDSEDKIRAEEHIWQRWSELRAADAIFRAACWGRLFGGGAVLIGTEEADLQQELDTNRAHQLRFFRDYDAESLIPATRYTDHLTPEYGQIETYTVQPGDGVGKVFTCHGSRLIRFGGLLTSRKEASKINSWDHSILRPVYSDLRDFAATWGSVQNMLIDASMPILTIKDLWQILAGKLKEQFTERLEVINLARWSARVMPLDLDEKYEYVERTFTGVPETLDRLMLRICSVTGIPATKLFGRSPAGLNATGESDVRNWYDTIQDQRERVYRDPIETIVQMIAFEQGVPFPESWGISWPSLWQETPKEMAERMNLTAQMDVSYIDTGVLTPDEVAMARFGGGEWSDAAPQLDLDARSLQVNARESAQEELRGDAWRYDPEGGRRPDKEKKGQWIVQSVVFPDDWESDRMRKWLEDHKYLTGLDGNRARQYDPEAFDDFRSHKVEAGVVFVLGHVK